MDPRLQKRIEDWRLQTDQQNPNTPWEKQQPPSNRRYSNVPPGQGETSPNSNPNVEDDHNNKWALTRESKRPRLADEELWEGNGEEGGISTHRLYIRIQTIQMMKIKILASAMFDNT
ncbi:hypothetical protein TWF481_011413 [Arthrobotrys musiformis]|uniref:Uncharacterized protein n=1 Tax=Arthrobotrys musiformis TaxID=47236 RepID=A0AAV9VZP6_9PEZI